MVGPLFVKSLIFWLWKLTWFVINYRGENLSVVLMQRDLLRIERRELWLSYLHLDLELKTLNGGTRNCPLLCDKINSVSLRNTPRNVRKSVWWNGTNLADGNPASTTWRPGFARRVLLLTHWAIVSTIGLTRWCATVVSAWLVKIKKRRK